MIMANLYGQIYEKGSCGLENINKLEMSIIYPDGKSDQGERDVISEHELTVTVNEITLYRIICIKDHLKELVTGRLFTDRLIEDRDDISRLFFCRYEKEVSVFLKKDISPEDTIGPDLTCCSGNRVYVAAKKPGLKKLIPCELKKEWVFELVKEFGKGTRLHELTSAVHICILAREGKKLFVSEDIGRHNAVDKAVGYALLNGIPLSECMLFTSGRVPVDMVEKVIAAGIPVLVSKSVPTQESVLLSHEFGLTLICRAWPDRFELY